MSDIKVIKKGQFLFKAGDKIQSVYVIQSGQVSLCLLKNNKFVDIMTVGNGYVFADLVVLGSGQYLYSAMAQQELKVTEIPLALFKSQYEALNPLNKTFIKTMAEKLKWAVNEVKNVKQEKSSTPCPEESIPRAFGAIFHVLNHKGIKEGSHAKADWLTMKNYSQRIFGESPKRIEHAAQILVKLKQAEYQLGRDVNNPESESETEIVGLEVYNLPALEAFFEFYQYYYYKGGRSELLKYDEANYNTLRILLMAYADMASDKFGVVSRDFNEVVEFFKDYGISLGAGHFSALEAKGLFCKRKNTADGKVQLQFDYNEFKIQIDMWSLIREIDKLNEKGYVDMTEVDEGPRKKVIAEGSLECGECATLIAVESKFCSECGARIQTHALSERKAA